MNISFFYFFWYTKNIIILKCNGLIEYFSYSIWFHSKLKASCNRTSKNRLFFSPFLLAHLYLRLHSLFEFIFLNLVSAEYCFREQKTVVPDVAAVLYLVALESSKRWYLMLLLSCILLPEALLFPMGNWRAHHSSRAKCGRKSFIWRRALRFSWDSNRQSLEVALELSSMFIEQAT